MHDALDELARRGLRVLHHLVHRVHGRGGDTRLLEDLEQRLPIVLRDGLLELRLQLVAVLHALDVDREARVRRHPREPEGPDQAMPEPVVGARDEDPLAVAAPEVPVRRERRVRGAERPGHGAAEQIPLGVVVQERHGGLEERAVHALAEARPLPVEQRVHDPERAEDARRQIEERDAAADGRAVGLARDRHDAAEGLHERLVAGAVGAGSRAPEGRDRAVDEPRVDGRERLVAQTERLHRPRPEVLDQDVAPAHESRQHLGALRRLEVERDRAPVAVDDEVRRRLALLVGRPGARLVARARVLHFDAVGAQVREQHAAEGAGQDARAIDDTDAVEREGRARHVRYYTSMSTLRDALRQKILVLDGAMGTMIQAAGLRAEDFGGARYEGCNEYLTLTRPDVIREVHAAYLEAGADLISTNTFGCAPYVLGEYGLAERAYEIARAAARHG